MSAEFLNEMTCVYIAFCAETGLYKIGTTCDLQRRINQLQYGSAFPIVVAVEFICPAFMGTAFEGFLHRLYSEKRTHGEWFKLDPELIERLNSLCFMHAFRLECAFDPETASVRDILGEPGDHIPWDTRRGQWLIGKHLTEGTPAMLLMAQKELADNGWRNVTADWWVSPKGYIFEIAVLGYCALREFGADAL